MTWVLWSGFYLRIMMNILRKTHRHSNTKGYWSSFKDKILNSIKPNSRKNKLNSVLSGYTLDEPVTVIIFYQLKTKLVERTSILNAIESRIQSKWKISIKSLPVLYWIFDKTFRKNGNSKFRYTDQENVCSVVYNKFLVKK